MKQLLLWNVSATRLDSSRLAIFYSIQSEYFSFFYPAQSTHTYRNKARLRLPYENIVVFRSKTLFGSEDLNSFARSTPSLRTLMKSQARPTALVCHDQLTCKNDKSFFYSTKSEHSLVFFYLLKACAYIRSKIQLQ